MSEDKPIEFVQETLKLFIAISGIMLSIVWSNFGKNICQELNFYVRWGTISLFSSIFFAVICFLFIVSESLRRKCSSKLTTSIASEKTVGITFMLVLICFLVGVGFMAYSLAFAIEPKKTSMIPFATSIVHGDRPCKTQPGCMCASSKSCWEARSGVAAYLLFSPRSHKSAIQAPSKLASCLYTCHPNPHRRLS